MSGTDRTRESEKHDSMQQAPQQTPRKVPRQVSFPTTKRTTIQGVFEFLAVAIVFYLFAAWPVPDSNEPHYIGKAIHFWNPDWIPNDSFLESKDSHLVFYVVFGWLSFFFSPVQMAWIGRFASWFLLAWGWRRLSRALLPVRWTAVITAMAVAYYVDSFHMAGEWILGGVEGKSFAFVFIFFGLEAMVRGRWHRTWIFLGIASAFHVLVGGWTVLACGFVWLLTDGARRLRRRKVLENAGIPWGLFLGGVLSLPGLIPALMLDAGASPDVVRQAHQIYVFERLYHHLVPYQLPWIYVARFLLLTLFWIVCCRAPFPFLRHRSRKLDRFDLFVWGALGLSMIGFLAAWLLKDNRPWAAEILRFYWFRLADVAVPMGVAVGAVRRLVPLVRKLRLSVVGPERFPSFAEWFVLLAPPFVVYLLLDDLIFGRLLFSWTLPAEQGIPWIATLLICRAVLFPFERFSRSSNRSDRCPTSHPMLHRWGLILLYGAVALYAPFDSLKRLGDLRTRFAYSRIENGHAWMVHHWIDACHWISQPENTNRTDKFWVPREGATFKWHARRSDVGTWKDVPQDAESILRWHETMRELFACDNPEHKNRSLTVQLWWKTDEEIRRLREKYGFDYVLCTAYPELPHLTSLRNVYENKYYRVYKVETP